MQDVENNLDELFRNAAGNYPLRTSKDDWDKIALQLVSNSIVVAGHEKSNFKKNIALLLFFFLFLLIAVIATKDSWHNAGSLQKQSAQQPAQIVTERKQAINHGRSLLTRKRNQQQLVIDENVLINQNNRPIKSSRAIFEKEQQSVGSVPQTNSAADTVVASENKQQDAVIDEDNLPGNIVAKQTVADTTKWATIGLTNGPTKQRGIYWGIVLGPSFNQVKSQGLNKPGYDVGLLAGYQFNKKLSVEAGLLFEKKYYFSDGKYFDMTKAGASMPAGMKILSLDGSCSVFEIPFKVKYNLAGKSNRHFYITSGISTYIITNEYNKYQAIMNGVQQNVTGTYNNTSRYIAAVLDAGVGFDNKIGRFVRVRIEPYFQIPLKGIGVGSLQVMTAGLHIGLIRAKN